MDSTGIVEVAAYITIVFNFDGFGDSLAVSISPVVAFFSIIDFWDQFVIEFIAYVATMPEALVYI